MMFTTNYYNTLITVAEDCSLGKSEMPPLSQREKSVARLQFEMLINHPYQFTSDELLFQVFCTRKGIVESDYEVARTAFFSKGQACLRTSPLAKRYGYGFHFDQLGKVALVAVESNEYRRLLSLDSLRKVKAMRLARK